MYLHSSHGLALAGLLVLMPHAAQAQFMKPGLWEYQSTMKSQSGEMESAMAEMQKHMASLPPDQRRQMEQMMSAQGVQMGQNKGGAQVMRICITPEEASRLDLQPDPGCKQEILQRTPSMVRMRFSCGGEVPSQGEGTIQFKSDSAFTGKFTMQTRADGKTDKMEVTQDAKWLGANCGNLKPRR